jgi:hypothetical protein
MGFSLLGEEDFFVIIGIKKLFVTGLPDTIEDCCGQTVYSKDLPAAIPEIYEYEHL